MIDGIINVYKEQGFTSFDVVAKLRGILKMKKIGHTGTLDPQAEGVLPVCLGNGTKLCSIMENDTKEYRATMELGIETDTQDHTGKIINTYGDMTYNEKEITEIIYSFIGNYQQVPPMYSAKKVDGKKLYELARSGIEIERKPCDIVIHEIEVLEMQLPIITIRVKCSKGTYIRTLCHDIGKKAGSGAIMTKLLRTRAGDFSVKDSLKLQEIEDIMKTGRIQDAVLPVDLLFDDLAKAIVRPEAFRFLENGNSLNKNQIEFTEAEYKDSLRIRIYDSKGRFFGIYQKAEQENIYKPYKMFFPSENKA